MKSHTIFIRPDGEIKHVYSDDLRFLVDQAKHVEISRGSTVEPTSDGLWVADMAPIHGPKSPAFKLRSEALDWEIDYINRFLAQQQEEV